jgi:hypothetical protein
MKNEGLLHSTARIRKVALFLTIAALAVAVTAPQAGAAGKKRGGPAFSKEGELLMPKNYRNWIFVGAPVTPNDMNKGKAAFPEFHNVYIDPASFAVYRKTGKFRNGTILVKELVGVGAKSASSGNGYFPGEFIGVAATVKDEKRFPGEPGNWAYFSFMGDDGKTLARAKALPTAACNECHQKTAAEDWVFTQFYPVLRAAKGGR